MAEQNEQEEEEIAERTAPGSHVVYRAILDEGEEELERSTSALGWSGLAAGLSMGWSFIKEAALSAHLPEAEWSPLISKFGYSIGFLLVILGRQQLFTENTLTPVLPFLKHPSSPVFWNVLRLWAVVFLANMTGALVFSWVAVSTDLLEPNVLQRGLTLAHEAVSPSFGLLFLRAIFAGWLIALMVWLLPFAESARIWVILILTYLVGAFKFSHVVAGATEAFALAWARQSTFPASFRTSSSQPFSEIFWAESPSLLFSTTRR